MPWKQPNPSLTNSSAYLEPRVSNVETSLADIIYNVKNYFNVGDTDYTNAIRNAYAATPDGGTLYLPAGWYQYSDTLTFNRPVNLKFDGNLEYIGTRDKSTIVIDNLTSITIKFNIIKDVAPSRTTLNYDGWHGWVNDNYIGVVLQNLKDCDIEIKHVIDFNIGVRARAYGGGGYWYNRLKINQLSNNRIQLDLCSDGANSWMNANYFYDTAFLWRENTSFSSVTFDHICVNQSLLNGNAYGGNGDRFKNFKFETHVTYGGTFTAIKLFRANGYRFDNYRCELMGSNSVFCILDLSGTLSSDISFCSRGILFDPLWVVPGAVQTVQLVTPDQGKNSYSDIYSFLPATNKYLLFDEQELNKRYRFLTTNRHTIKNVLRKSLSSTDLNETLTDFTTSDMSLVNGANISSSYPLVFYITNLSLGDELSVEIGKSDSTQSPSIRYKVWDNTGTFCTGGLIGTVKALAHFGSWNSGTNTENPSATTTIDKFTINSASVGTVAIMVYGGIRSVRIYTTNRNNITKKTNIAKIEKLDGFLSDVVPTKNIDGYFKPGDIVYYYDGTNVTQYVLTYSAGTYTWTSQGTLNL